jgi:chromosome segregation ATPase
MEEVMSRWWLVLVIAVASSTASAEPRQPAPAFAATVASETAMRSAEQLVTRLAAKREDLARRYQDQLGQIDRLKNQRASWRRDRELRDSLSESLETANQLSATTRELGQARTGLESARRAYLTAIDAELGAGAAPARASVLVRARAQLVPQL